MSPKIPALTLILEGLRSKVLSGWGVKPPAFFMPLLKDGGTKATIISKAFSEP